MGQINLKTLYQIIVIFTIVQRLYELYLSQNNIKYLKTQGAFVVKEINYFFMVLLHTVWLTTCLYLAFNSNDVLTSRYFVFGLLFFITGQSLRIIAIKTLGKRWTTKIVILPEKPAVHKGIFLLVNHPNYLGVCLEIFALPVMIMRFDLAILFSVLNFIILFFRIRKEESHLSQFNNYRNLFKGQGHEA
jgi:methyltransferase